MIGRREGINLDVTHDHNERYFKDQQEEYEIPDHEQSMLPYGWSNDVRKNEEGPTKATDIHRVKRKLQASNDKHHQQQKQEGVKGRYKRAGNIDVTSSTAIDALTPRTNIALAPIESFLSSNFFVLSGPTEQISPFFLQQSMHCYPRALSLEQLRSGVSNVPEAVEETITTGKRKKKYKKYPQSKRKQLATDSSENSSSQSQSHSQDQDLVPQGGQNDRIFQRERQQFQQQQEQYQLQHHFHRQQEQESKNQFKIISNYGSDIDLKMPSSAIGLGSDLGKRNTFLESGSLTSTETCAIASTVNGSVGTTQVGMGLISTDIIVGEDSNKQHLPSLSSSMSTEVPFDARNTATVVSSDSFEKLQPESDFGAKVDVNQSKSASIDIPRKSVYNPFDSENDLYDFSPNIPTKSSAANKDGGKSSDPWTYDFFQTGVSEALVELVDPSSCR